LQALFNAPGFGEQPVATSTPATPSEPKANGIPGQDESVIYVKPDNQASSQETVLDDVGAYMKALEAANTPEEKAEIQKKYREAKATSAQTTGMGVADSVAKAPDNTTTFSVADAQITEPTAEQRFAGAPVAKKEEDEKPKATTDQSPQQVAEEDGRGGSAHNEEVGSDQLTQKLITLGISPNTDEGKALFALIDAGGAEIVQKVMDKINELGSNDLVRAEATMRSEIKAAKETNDFASIRAAQEREKALNLVVDAVSAGSSTLSSGTAAKAA
jgi:hypothetical protein